ncbi:MAG TPA: low temperature requirement protein A [Dysgonomonas sp.]|nr:low temperature requirement protein A [Dysgonomonas sp.]
MNEVRSTHKLLRDRKEHDNSVSFSELLFDLIYVFAVTQLSHYFLHNLDSKGFFETSILWFGIWLVWQHTTWVTNWFNPDKRPIRLLLFAVMVISLFMTAALPEAFGEKGVIFAVCYVTIQVGRTLVILFLLGNNHLISNNYKRILGWMCISGVFWIIGAFQDTDIRIYIWAAAVLLDYTAPMFGFYLPGLGRSDSKTEWTIDGHHLVERSQLFVIIAFGETILMTGASLSEIEVWSTEKIIASLVSFIGSLAMWWVYFDISSEAASHKIEKVNNPGSLGLKYHAIHVILVGAIIICAVGDEFVVNEPGGQLSPILLFILIFGPIIYLLANILFKWITFRSIPLSHVAGIILLLVLIPFSYRLDILITNAIVVGVFIMIAVIELLNPANKQENLEERI